MSKIIPFLLFILLSISCSVHKNKSASTSAGRPKISFTFDDGITADMPGYDFKTWNGMLFQHLEKEQVKTVFFVTGSNKTDAKGRYLLESWNDAGHRIGNHTFSHPSYNSTTYQGFELEFLKTDSIIRAYNQHIKLFRFPYLQEGNTKVKIAQFRSLLQANGYRNGAVTIDASDWAIDCRLVKKLKANPDADLEPFRQFYQQHLFNRAEYYEKLSLEMTGRHISHTLLLHHNLAAALFADDLIAFFRAKGWDIISADQAFEDEIFKSQPSNVPAGQSLIWALAKQSGQYEALLRYPAEDETYEKEKMDALGL